MNEMQRRKIRYFDMLRCFSPTYPSMCLALLCKFLKSRQSHYAKRENWSLAPAICLDTGIVIGKCQQLDVAFNMPHAFIS